MQVDSSHRYSDSFSFDQLLGELFEQYATCQEPILVDFRKMVSVSAHGKRGATHLIHTYPAKLLMHIPHFFISSSLLSKPKDLVLDPFCGSGTVLLESLISDRNAIGADSNPLARLIAKVKTTPIEGHVLIKHLDKLMANLPTTATTSVPNVVNIEYWFHKRVISQLHILVESINRIDSPSIRDFFLVCFSNCVRKVSLADLQVSVPVRLNVERYTVGDRLHTAGAARLAKLDKVNVIDEFKMVTHKNIKKVANLQEMTSPELRSVKIYGDSRSLYDESRNRKQGSNTVQLIITSPPYAGAQKYIRSSSLSLGWLGFCESNTLRDFERLNIGREHYAKYEYSDLSLTNIQKADKLLKAIFKDNPLRACIAANYLLEMKEAFSEMVRVLKPSGYLVLVVANNQVCGRQFETQDYLRQIVEDLGLHLKLKVLDDINSRGLMTKRNKTAGIISSEWVLVFQKSGG